MQTLELDLNKRYSYADYLTWFDDKRRELYDGFIKLITPAPSRVHQEISLNLVTEIKNFLKKKKCKVYNAPFDVRFPKSGIIDDRKIFTVVQPDICIICDIEKLDVNGCIGAPDMIVEIISPKNSRRDIKDKFQIYEENGVREYWIVHPNDQTVIVFMLDENSKYKQVGMFANDEKIQVNIFNGELEIDLTEVFN
jgi:Uma2 family endonuclease